MSLPKAQQFREEGASAEVLAELRSICDLPTEYLELLASSNGGEGSLSVRPYNFILDSAEEALRNYRERTFAEHCSRFFVFGSDGGGKLLAFDMRGAKPWPVVCIDMTHIDVAGSVQKVADDFSVFVTYIGTEPRDA